jgi:hypothetical protein
MNRPQTDLLIQGFETEIEELAKFKLNYEKMEKPIKREPAKSFYNLLLNFNSMFVHAPTKNMMLHLKNNLHTLKQLLSQENMDLNEASAVFLSIHFHICYAHIVLKLLLGRYKRGDNASLKDSKVSEEEIIEYMKLANLMSKNSTDFQAPKQSKNVHSIIVKKAYDSPQNFKISNAVVQIKNNSMLKVYPGEAVVAHSIIHEVYEGYKPHTKNADYYSLLISEYSHTPEVDKLIQKINEKMGPDFLNRHLEKKVHWRVIYKDRRPNKLVLFKSYIENNPEHLDKYKKLFENVGARFEPHPNIDDNGNEKGHVIVLAIEGLIATQKTTGKLPKTQAELELRTAANAGDTEKVLQILNDYPDIDINAIGPKLKQSALHYAINNNHVSTILALLGRGADPLPKNSEDASCALSLAAGSPNEARKILHEYLTDIHTIDGSEKCQEIKSWLAKNFEKSNMPSFSPS